MSASLAGSGRLQLRRLVAYARRAGARQARMKLLPLVAALGGLLLVIKAAHPLVNVAATLVVAGLVIGAQRGRG